MEFISWQKYYEQHKHHMQLNEMVANYNLWLSQYEALEENTLWLQKGQSDFLLQENGFYILQEQSERERGGRIIWRI
jgi:hypothetical protein